MKNNKIKTKQTRRVFIIRNMYIYLPPKIRQYIIALLYFFLLIHCILPLPNYVYIFPYILGLTPNVSTIIKGYCIMIHNKYQYY